MKVENNLNIHAVMEKRKQIFRDLVCRKLAAEAEQHAKQNRPWKDRTGDARKLLKGAVIDNENELGFRIMHRKEYGQYLETANKGKYAILKPTIEHFRDRFMALLKECFGGKM